MIYFYSFFLADYKYSQNINNCENAMTDIFIGMQPGGNLYEELGHNRKNRFSQKAN